MDEEQILAMQELAANIERHYAIISDEKSNYYDYLGISKIASSLDIEDAYRKMRRMFSPERIDLITDAALREKGEKLVQKLRRAFDVLMDYDRRADYEKKGFREEIPADEIKQDPLDRARMIYQKAKTLYAQKEYRKVALIMEEALNLDPGKPDYHALLGLAQTNVPTMKRQAEANLLKAIELEPWNAEHCVAMGLLYYSENMPKKAESYFRKALTLDNGHPLARRKLLEIAGPDKSKLQMAMEKTQGALQKSLPSIFGRKKSK